MSGQLKTPRKITVIPQDSKYAERDIRKQHLRVAPYCRVSTNKEEQLASYEAQMEYYTTKIAENKDWTMVGLYADEGISGTSTKKRKSFLKMIRDCEKGNMAKTRLLAKKAELERQGRTAAEFDRRMEQLGAEIDKANPAISNFDDITVRQLISNIKVLGEGRILVRFKDGTEIEQSIEDTRKVRAS